MREESGFTLVELLVSVVAGLVVMIATLALVDLTVSNSARVAARVDANQRAKPVLQRLMDQLHSACIAPGIAPVLGGSSDSQLTYQQQTGSAVTPTPDRHVVTLSAGTLNESVYPASGGQAPEWSFAGTPSSTRQLLTDVAAASEGSPPVSVPVFRYFASQAGALSSSPLPTPLSVTDAKQAVQVSITFEVAPSSTPVDDENAAITVSDAVVFRFSPFSEDATKVNGPCA